MKNTRYRIYFYDRKKKDANKGDRGFKILQKEIGGIPICAEIYQKTSQIYFWGS